jgi:hypothetical protein
MVGPEVLQWNLGMLCIKIWLVGVLGQWESSAICCSLVVRKRVFRSNYGDNFFTCFLHTLAVDGPYSLELAGLVLNCPESLVMLALLPLRSICLMLCLATLFSRILSGFQHQPVSPKPLHLAMDPREVFNVFKFTNLGIARWSFYH